MWECRGNGCELISLIWVIPVVRPGPKMAKNGSCASGSPAYAPNLPLARERSTSAWRDHTRHPEGPGRLEANLRGDANYRSSAPRRHRTPRGNAPLQLIAFAVLCSAKLLAWPPGRLAAPFICQRFSPRSDQPPRFTETFFSMVHGSPYEGASQRRRAKSARACICFAQQKQPQSGCKNS